MSYEDTIEEDIIRAKQILEDGKAEPSNLPMPDHVNFGGTIYGKDIYPAYKLLESFIEEITRLNTLAASQAPKTIKAHWTRDGEMYETSLADWLEKTSQYALHSSSEAWVICEAREIIYQLIRSRVGQ